MSDVFKLVKVRGHVGSQHHLYHQPSQQFIVLTGQVLQEVGVILIKGGRVNVLH